MVSEQKTRVDYLNRNSCYTDFVGNQMAVHVLRCKDYCVTMKRAFDLRTDATENNCCNALAFAISVHYKITKSA